MYNKTNNEMFDLLKKLFPICRSLTGEGNRETLEIINNIIPLKIEKFDSGTECYDWTIPEEWVIKDAFIKDKDGNNIVSFKSNNLHVVSYSSPIDKFLKLKELKKNLYSDPLKPDSIPYRTSYYKKRWGFCIEYNKLKNLNENETFHVKIDSSFKKGSLDIAQSFLKGNTDKEILFSSYICHPSMANDSLSGVVLQIELYKFLKKIKSRKYSYRFVFLPETIGAIAFLHKNGEYLRKKLLGGFQLTCLGDNGDFNYKKTKFGNHLIDRISENILKFSGFSYKIRPFWPLGSDERQYSSPGFNFPIGSLMRSVYGEFKEYHTSKDDLNFVNSKSLNETLSLYKKIIKGIELNEKYLRTNPYCEPMLGKHGLYNTLGGENNNNKNYKDAYLWILNYADSYHDLIYIAEKMKVDISTLDIVINNLMEKKLIKIKR